MLILELLIALQLAILVVVIGQVLVETTPLGAIIDRAWSIIATPFRYLARRLGR